MLLFAFALLAANPATLTSVLNAAKPGDTIRLAAATYPAIQISKRSWTPPVTIDATGATVASLHITTSTGITWKGGTMVGTNNAAGDAKGKGIAVGGSKAITITGVQLSNFRTGIGFGQVDGGVISNNTFTKMSSDGIAVSSSKNLVIDRNSCTDSDPAPHAHPDCIQMFSKPAFPPVSDVVISNNTVVGATQGIGMFNHVRKGVDDGGFDRVTVRNNNVRITYSMGIAVTDCRSCTVRDNVVDSLPNYIHRAQLGIGGGSVYQCGNVVPMVPRQGTPPCPK